MRQKQPVHPGTATGRREGVHVESDHEQRALQPSTLRKRKRHGQARPGAAATHAGDQRHTGREPAHRPPRQCGLLRTDGLQGQTVSQRLSGEIRAPDQRQIRGKLAVATSSKSAEAGTSKEDQAREECYKALLRLRTTFAQKFKMKNPEHIFGTATLYVP